LFWTTSRAVAEAQLKQSDFSSKDFEVKSFELMAEQDSHVYERGDEGQ